MEEYIVFYIYEWYNAITREVFYVGKGTKKRYLQVSRRNQYFKDYYQNNPCEVRIISYYDSEEEAFKAENQRILELKAIGQCKCNLDNGGTGGVNYVWTEEMREYKSKFNPMKRAEQRERMSHENPMKNPEVAKKVASKKQKKVIYKVKDTSPLCKALKAGKKYKGHDCCYANQQPSDTNSDNSSIEGSETNG